MQQYLKSNYCGGNSFFAGVEMDDASSFKAFVRVEFEASE